MPQGQRKLAHRRKARSAASPYPARKAAKVTKKGKLKRGAKTNKARKDVGALLQKKSGSWIRNVEMMAAQKLKSTGANLSMSDLKSKAAEQAQFDKARMLTRRNKTRAAQAERKANRIIATATKELEELHTPATNGGVQ